jgi:hypothetical protein
MGIIPSANPSPHYENSNSKSGTRKAKNQKTSHRFTRIRTDFFNQSVQSVAKGFRFGIAAMKIAILNLEQEKPKTKRPATDLHGFARIFLINPCNRWQRVLDLELLL